MNSKISGVGINDAGYKVTRSEVFNGKRKRVWICPYYAVWLRMIHRCYAPSSLKQRPTYTECSVTDKWFRFSNFKSWMETQDWENKQLDKDLLVSGNKVYSPDTCIFVTCSVNNFVVENTTERLNSLTGVHWAGHAGKFRAECGNPFTKKKENLGYFTDVKTAHQAWLSRKLELAKLLAAEQDDQRVAKALVERYENYTEV